MGEQGLSGPDDDGLAADSALAERPDCFDGLVEVEDASDDGAHRAAVHEGGDLAELVAAGAVESPLLPLAETISVLRTVDDIRQLVGVRFPGE